MLAGCLSVLANRAFTPPTIQVHLPNWILDYTITTRFDQQGQVLSYLQADRSFRYQRQDRIWMERASLRYSAVNRPALLITAPFAHSQENGRLIWLPKEASMVQAAHASQPALRIVGSNVWMKPRPDRLIWSAAPVSAVMGQNIVSGIGFSADLNKMQLTIHSKVKTTHSHAP